MSDALIDLGLDPDAELDPEDAERLTRQLRIELAELDVGAVDLVSDGAAPGGSKAADAVTIGAIVVALSASGGVFTRSSKRCATGWVGTPRVTGSP